MTQESKHVSACRAAALRPGPCALVVAAVVLAAGCSGSARSPGATDVPSTGSPSAPTSASSTPTTDQAVILRNYAALWGALTPASRAAAGRRRALLAAYVADPALSSLLRGMVAEDKRGRVFYGRDRLRPKLRGISVAQGVAIIDDCLDSTASGVADRRTLQPLTVGVARNHVVSTMHLLPNVGWRVVFITYPKTPC